MKIKIFKLFLYFLIFQIISCNSSDLFSQQTFFLKTDSIPANTNFFSNLFDKQFNIYRLNTYFAISKKIFSGELLLKNDYNGFLIKTNENAVRDIENLNLEFNHHILEDIKLFLSAEYTLNSDSKSIGLNQAERIKSDLGIDFNYSKDYHITTAVGIERNKQVSIVNYGPRVSISLKELNLKFSDFNFAGMLLSENSYLNQGKRNSDLVVQGKLFANFVLNNSFELNLNYTRAQRDYLAFPITSNDNFERRIESKINPMFSLAYNLLDSFFLQFSGYVNSYQIKKSFNKFINSNPQTAIERTLSEQIFDFTLKFDFRSRFISPTFGLNLFYRNEENILNRKFQIDEQSFNQLAFIESQKNNYQSKFDLFGNLHWTIDRENKFIFFGNLGIFRYDTPSEFNDDDRDEFKFLGTFNYYHKFSKFINFKTELEFQLNHLVFIKASKSSLNNWNRILRFCLSPEYSSSYLRYAPAFEIISNYVSYDFEPKITSIKSFAFRQFIYRDTVLINFTRKFFLSGYLIYKYSERGLLFWKNFAMTKETEIFELFLRELFNYKIGNQNTIGIGVRVYNIKQESKSGLSLQNQYSFYSISPETEIKIFLSNNNVIFLQGWYELKFGEYKLIGETANLLLKLSIFF